MEEKSAGRIGAAEVTSVTIDDIRLGGPFRVAQILSEVQPGSACIVNAAGYRDMEVLVTALLKVEESGKEFLYRTAASFVRTRTGLDHRAELLSKNELVCDNDHGGLFVIGSYVEKTSLQVKALFNKTDIKAIEVQVDALLDPLRNKTEIARVATSTSALLTQGKYTAIYTSRVLITGKTAESSLSIGQTISNSLIEIVRAISVQPRYLVAKGGITSSDVATKGLGVQRAMVIGQALPGIPAWELGPESRYPGMSYSIGGGPGCSGQLLVTPDVLGLYDNFTPSFAKQYQDVGTLMLDTFKQYKEEVISGVFPGEEHSYKMSDEVLEAIEKEFGKA